MTEPNDADLQKPFGGLYVARRGHDVLASARTYDELDDQLEALAPDWQALTVEFVEPADAIRVYGAPAVAPVNAVPLSDPALCPYSYASWSNRHVLAEVVSVSREQPSKARYFLVSGRVKREAEVDDS